MSRLARYPVYVISKGRAFRPLTANFLRRDGQPFKIVIEESEYDEYVKTVDPNNILVLPKDFREQAAADPRARTPAAEGVGGSIPARNFVWEHAKATGAERHWILDDNIRDLLRLYKGQRVVCRAGTAFQAMEDFVDRFENVAIAGMNYKMFGFPRHPVFFLNVHVYSCILIRNDLPFRWRGRYNEDTDLCLQALMKGSCTVLSNIFLCDKLPTLQMKGGNMDKLYKTGSKKRGAVKEEQSKRADGSEIGVSAEDGRRTMAHDLARAWPGVVRVTRRFGRSQHLIDWRKFGQRLQPKPEWQQAYAAQPSGLLAELTPPAPQPGQDEYDLQLVPRVSRDKLDKEIGAFFDDYERTRTGK